MRPFTSVSCAALAAVALSATPASAATISPTGVRFPQVAVNAQGRTIAAWEREAHGRFNVEARLGDAPARLGRTVTLARVAYAPKVAAGADGTVAVQWSQPGPGRDVRIFVAVARPGHGLGAPQTLVQRKGLVSPIGVAVQPNGRVVALLQLSAHRIAIAVAAPGHRFGRATTLAATGGTMAIDPRDGTIVVSYGTAAGQQAAVVTLAPAATAFAAPVVLSPDGPFELAFPVAVSGPGGAAVAYTLSGDKPGLAIARRGVDGSWSTREQIAAGGPIDDVFAEGLQATIAADGSAVAAWSAVRQAPNGLGGDLDSHTVASIAGRGAPFGAPAALTPVGAKFGFPAVAAAGGEVFVASAETHGRLLVSTRAAGATAFGAPVRLATGIDGDVQLAAAGARVLLAYQQHDRLRLRVLR